jgi:hypothetical protein
VNQERLCGPPNQAVPPVITAGFAKSTGCFRPMPGTTAFVPKPRR